MTLLRTRLGYAILGCGTPILKRITVNVRKFGLLQVIVVWCRQVQAQLQPWAGDCDLHRVTTDDI